MNMELEIVSFEQAKALKSIGFPQDRSTQMHFYYKDGKLDSNFNDEPVAAAPTYAEVEEWFRVEKKMNVAPEYAAHSDELDKWYPTYGYINGTSVYYTGMPVSYVEAISIAIDAAIELIIFERKYGKYEDTV